MNTLRKLIGLVFLMGMTMPAAAQKVYTLSLSLVDATTVDVTVTNVSPARESNSTLNSFRINSPVDIALTGSASVSLPATVTRTSARTLAVKDFNGVKAYPLSPSSITIRVKLAAPTCGDSTWTIDGYTGNSLNGPINFYQVDASGTKVQPPGTKLSGPACQLSLTVPNVAFINKAFDATVSLNGGPTPSDLKVTWACSTKSGSGVATSNPLVFSVTLTETGSCNVTASATGYTSVTKTIANVYTGTLECYGNASSSSSGAGVNVLQDWSYPQGNNALPNGGWSLIRGPNKVGDPCTAAVPYTFTLDLSGKQTASFIVPSTETQKVSAQYVIVWAPVKTSGLWTAPRPGVAWKLDSSNQPIYMPALACLSDPTDFSQVPQGNLQDYLPTIPPQPDPQPAWLAAYPVGTKALMCVSQQGWTALGPDGNETLIQPWTKVIDQGDGYTSRDF